MATPTGPLERRRAPRRDDRGDGRAAQALRPHTTGTAKTQMMGDDLLACMLSATTAHRCREDPHRALARPHRDPITAAPSSSPCKDRFIATVEQLSGRRVTALHLQPPRRARPLALFARRRARLDERSDDRSNGRADAARRLVTETKARLLKTTEFFAFLVVLAGILVSAAVVDEKQQRRLWEPSTPGCTRRS